MKNNFNIESLNGIRAFSFLLVFIAHAGASKIIPGGFGVTVFFFLSGYLITTLLRIEYESTLNINLRLFFIRRALRIFPLQIIVLTLAIFLTLVKILPGELLIKNLILQLFNFTNYITMSGTEGIPFGTGVYWSLAVEEHFYLIFPFLLFYLIKKFNYREVALIFSVLCILILTWRISLVLNLDNFTERIYRGTDTRIDSILFGCILGLVYNPKLDIIPFKIKIWNYLIIPCCLIVIIFTFLLKNEYLRETIRYTLQGMALFPVFIFLIKNHEYGLNKILNIPLFRKLGELSYSLYLIHIIIIYIVKKYLYENIIIGGIIALIFSIFIALLLNMVIEKPMNKLRKRYSVFNQEKKVIQQVV